MHSTFFYNTPQLLPSAYTTESNLSVRLRRSNNNNSNLRAAHTSPVFHGEQAVEVARDERRDLHQVVGAHARSQQALVGVAEGRVGDQQALVLADGLGESLGSALQQHIAPAGWLRRICFRWRGCTFG